MNKNKVLLGMSGGIDSTVSIKLLQAQGFEVIGLTLRLFSNFINDNSPAQLAEMLGIKHSYIDISEEFNEKIIGYFVSEYLAGKTPFPCVVCNETIKWKYLLKYADVFDCYWVATGHYVNKIEDNGFFYLQKGIDDDKDQSFFLWRLTQQQLRRSIFPLGKYLKSEVKKLAVNFGFPALTEKKESVGACFIPTDYRLFLNNEIQKRNITINEGSFRLENETFVGKHKGYPYFTVGQRRGLGGNFKTPMYVYRIDSKENKVYLGEKQKLFKNNFTVEKICFANESDISENKEVIVKIRYRKQATPAKIQLLGKQKAIILLLEPLDSIAPGQAAAFYSENRLLGGGFISE